MNKTPHKIIAQNRQARFQYHILENLEAGIMLTGSELKSLRLGQVSIQESFAGEMSVDGHVGLYLFNANINEYEKARLFAHEPKRPRKLLIRKRQMNKLLGAVRKKGLTLVALSLYFNEKGRVKVDLALAKGKNVVDKRETVKNRDWARDKARVLKNYNA